MAGRKSPRRKAREFVVQDLYGFLAKGEDRASILQKPKVLTIWIDRLLSQADAEQLALTIKTKDDLREYLQFEVSKLNIGDDFVVDRVIQVLISSSSLGSASPRQAQNTVAKHPTTDDRITSETWIARANAITEQYAALIQECLRNEGELTATITPYLSRPWDEVSPIERGILLLCVCELRFHPETPYRVIINEAIELSKTFGGTDGHKFVNGVLDKLARIPRDQLASQTRAGRGDEEASSDDRYPSAKGLIERDFVADYILYHNPDSMGFPFTRADPPLVQQPFWVVTNKTASHAIGNRVWVVTGEENPREYFLCACFVVEKVQRRTDSAFQTELSGTGIGFPIKPSLKMNLDQHFPDFLKRMGNFGLGFQLVSSKDDLAMLRRLGHSAVASFSQCDNC